MTVDFGTLLRKKLRDDMNRLADDVATGSAQSYDEYKRLCGVIQGLAIAERHLLDLAERMEKEDDGAGTGGSG